MADYKKEPKYWFSMPNGTHVPVFEGESKEDAAKRFLEEKEQERTLSIGGRELKVEQYAKGYDRDSFDKEAKKKGLDLTSDDIDEYVESSYGAKQLGDKISEFIDNAPDDMKVGDKVLYRGLYFESEEEMRDFLEQGKITSRRDGLSWTEDKDVADEFSKNASEYSVTLVNEDDAKNAISIKDISDTPSSSSEVLYSSSTDFDIVDVEYDGNHATVYVTEAVNSQQKYARSTMKEESENESTKIGVAKGYASVIERNEEGEILFKAMVTDKDTGERKPIEFSSSSKEQARQDLMKNGYIVTPRTLLPRNLFDKVMNETNAYDWDWEDAQEEFSKALKEEVKSKEPETKENDYGFEVYRKDPEFEFTDSTWEHMAELRKQDKFRDPELRSKVDEKISDLVDEYGDLEAYNADLCNLRERIEEERVTDDEYWAAYHVMAGYLGLDKETPEEPVDVVEEPAKQKEISVSYSKATGLIFGVKKETDDYIDIDGYSDRKTEKGMLAEVAHAIGFYDKGEEEVIRDMIKSGEINQFKPGQNESGVQYILEWEEVPGASREVDEDGKDINISGKEGVADEYKEAKYYCHIRIIKNKEGNEAEKETPTLEVSKVEDETVNVDNERLQKQNKLIDDTIGNSLGERQPVEVESRGNKLTELADAKDINPHFKDEGQKKRGEENYKNNCAICTLTTMLQMMGYDVEAGTQPNRGGGFVECSSIFIPDVTNPDNFIMSGSDAVFTLSDSNIRYHVRAALEASGVNDVSERDRIAGQVAAKVKKMPRGADKASKAIEEAVLSWGDGAFGELSVNWYRGSAHSLFIFNDNGVVKVFDMQNGLIRSGTDALKVLLTRCKANSTELIRYDNFVGFKPGAKDKISKVTKKKERK